MRCFSQHTSDTFIKRFVVAFFILAIGHGFSQTNPIKIASYPFQFPTEAIVTDTINNTDNVFGYEYQNSVKQDTKLHWIDALTYSVNVPTSYYAQGSGFFTTTWTQKAFYSSNKLYFANCPTSGRLVCHDIPNDTYYFWQKNFAGGHVEDIELRNDSLFLLYDPSGTTGSKIMLILNKNTGATTATTTIDNTQAIDDVFGIVKKIKLFGGKLLIGGKFAGLANSTFTTSNFLIYDITTKKCLTTALNFNDTVSDIEIYNNRVYVAGSFTTVNGAYRPHVAILNSNLTLNPASFNILGGEVKELEMHGKDMFMATTATTVQGMPIVTGYSLNTVLIDASVNLPPKWITPFTGAYPTCFTIQKHRLFMADKGGTNEAYCLTPIMPGFFSAFTNAVCQGAGIKTYSYTGALGANTYSWTYSGTGVTLFPNGNSAVLNFGMAATSGTLMAFTQSFCGNNSDTIKLFVNVYPIPPAVAYTTNNTLDCNNPKVPILCTSGGPNVVYSWSGPNFYSSNKQNDSTGYYEWGPYYCIATNTISGCSNNTWITINIDIAKPNVTLPSPVFIKCDPDSSLLNGSSTTSLTIIWWRAQGNGIQHPNPYYTKNIGNYFMVVKSNKNGCKDSSLFQVQLNTTPPVAAISSHTFINTVTPIDTVTCFKPNITIVGTTTTSGSDIKWRSIPANVTYSNPVVVTSQGNFRLIVTNTVNGCADSSIIALVAQDLTPPGITVTTPSPNIPCGSASTTLNAVCTITNSILQWTGPSSFTSSNPTTVTVQGKYFITATNTVNGCVKKDSVTVLNNNSLSIIAGRDTTVCKNSPITFSAVLISAVSGVNYSWSNGTNGQAITVTPTISTSYIVFGSNGSCSGQDTVSVTIPADLQDSIVASKGCDGNSFGSLSIFTKGGISPYRYSINSGPFSSQSTYTNLPFGNYSIIIKDSIGCTKSSSATIDQNSNLPQPVFIASTQNTKGDTIVLVDITNPKADSIQWVLPIGATKIGGTMFNPLIVFADTGYFNITMKAFYGSCMITRSKLIHVAPNDGSFANSYNANGIKSLTLYPNPNTGSFTVNVEFYKKQNSSVQVWDSQPEKHYQQNFLDTDYISIPINITQLNNGNYVLKVIGEYNSKHFNFIISK